MGSKSSFCDKFVTVFSGVASLTLIIMIFTVWKKPLLPNEAFENATQIQEVMTEGVCNCTVIPDPRLEHAKKFNEALKGKDFFGRVHHRITHREEAERAALCVTIILVVLVVALLYTRMWRDKEHHPLTFKQAATFPQGDRKTEILVGDMLKTRARDFVTYFRRRAEKSRWYRSGRQTQQDETDAGEILKMEDFITHGEQVPGFQRCLLLSSDEDILYSEAKINMSFENASTDSEGDEVFAIDSRTGEWKAHRQQPRTSAEMEEKRRRMFKSMASKRSKMLTPKRYPKKSSPLSRLEPGESEELEMSLLDCKSSESDQDVFEPL